MAVKRPVMTSPHVPLDKVGLDLGHLSPQGLDIESRDPLKVNFNAVVNGQCIVVRSGR
jgi:hypothetical protein